ncbi:alpha/beta hydrolase [Pseudonocardia sp. CA-142604]|uniref:alpha/beta hydrolase n=1 Tax=Pseudonocardia sp. CA-142604 TaxID=3240024 RepID=UPI003D8F37E4
MPFPRSERPTVLLVHGAWHGAWCWAQLEPELAALGWRSRAVQLPSAVAAEAVTESGLLPSSFDDAQVIREAIGDMDGPLAVVAHSYGGVPTTQATPGAENVQHLIYLAATVPDVGESLTSLAGRPQPDPESAVGAIPPPDGDAFYGRDVPEDLRNDAVSRLVSHSARSFADQVTQAGWHSIPSSYIVCDDDQAIPPSRQEWLATRTGAVYHLPSSHSPFLSMPAELAELLTKILA